MVWNSKVNVHGFRCAFDPVCVTHQVHQGKLSHQDVYGPKRFEVDGSNGFPWS